jgi:hypothetical protein
VGSFEAGEAGLRPETVEGADRGAPGASTTGEGPVEKRSLLRPLTTQVPSRPRAPHEPGLERRYGPRVPRTTCPEFALQQRPVHSPGHSYLDECTIALVAPTRDYDFGVTARVAIPKPNIGSGEAADIGASRRSDHSNRPFLARTPARPDWAKPGSEAARSDAGGFRV